MKNYALAVSFLLAVGSPARAQIMGGAASPVIAGANVTGDLTTATLPAANVDAGSLGASVIASSVAVNAITNAQTAAGTFSNITVPAANVAAGSLGGSVIASSVAVNAVSTLQINPAATPTISSLTITNASSGLSFVAHSSVTMGTLSLMPAGLVFFQSSTTISGSTFSTTANSSGFYFSTYTTPTNMFQSFNPGEALIVECLYLIGPGAATTARQNISVGTVKHAQTTGTSANNYTLLRYRLRKMQTGNQLEDTVGSYRWDSTAGTTALMDGTVGNPNGTASFSETSALVFNCGVDNQSAGVVNFISMTVSKGF